MSHIATCPNCGHVFEADDLFERYEEIVKNITSGVKSKKGSMSIDVIGSDGTTYQVKHSKERREKRWNWIFRKNHTHPDFFVLFGISKSYEIMFLIPYSIAEKNGNEYHDGSLHHSNDLNISGGGIGFSSWIWDYRVSPENFMARVNELKSSQQIVMSFTKGLGDE